MGNKKSVPKENITAKQPRKMEHLIDYIEPNKKYPSFIIDKRCPVEVTPLSKEDLEKLKRISLL